MNHGHIYFEIQADDPARAIAFYSEIFGWQFSEVEGLAIRYWRIETGGARGGLLARPAQVPPPDAERTPLSVLWKSGILTQPGTQSLSGAELWSCLSLQCPAAAGKGTSS